ncbi:MAG: GGDEF domain-containing protein, partial [Thermoanaerobaculia bacterium]
NIQRVLPDGDVMWLVGADAVYRCEAAPRNASTAQPRPLIHRVSTADGQTVSAPLRHAFGRMRIEFAPGSYRPGILYQYRLDPVDEAWSDWTTQPSIDYTNLDHGDYTFRVRARGAAGQTSEETQWTFSVRPPWYRTPTALLLWLLVAAALVAVIVRLRTTALRRQASRLQKLVLERTEDLQQANAHLERLSLLDELTGIATRRYFQRALVEDWRNAHEYGQPLALVLLDLDEFKQLNDRYGHPAGDAALVQVSRFLSRQIRRSGSGELGVRVHDLVARIGGEEFAVLLTGTSLEEAMRIAENMREGIATLPIETESRTLHATASAGVASVIPHEAEGWQALMREADRALYAAKNAGRNCVRAAGSWPPPGTTRHSTAADRRKSGGTR